MRIAALLLIVCACGACRSSGRDYMSINRSSQRFIRETFRKGNDFRRANLNDSKAFKKRAPRNKRQRKLSRQYASQSFLKGTGPEFDRMVDDQVKPTLDVNWKKIREAWRFGFLDSGQ